MVACGALVVALLSAIRQEPALGAPAGDGPGWIIEGAGSQNGLAAIQHLDPALADTYFDNARTIVLAGDATPSQPPRNEVPAGWPDTAAQHYTSYGPCTSNTGCASLTNDIANGALASAGVPVVMYDNENWAKTPEEEKANVCSYMNQFVQLAHANGLATIMAPDQNLASPGVITNYQGGESENWQTYLRLGLARCAVATGTDRYHIMSQPFQTHWCGGQGSACEGSESDYTNFVTQAALQARSVNPQVGLTAGLTTNPRYNTTPQALYQDTLDVRRLVDNFWLNVAPNPTTAGTGLQFLELLSGLEPLYLTPAGTLSPSFPNSSSSAAASLAGSGSDLTFLSAQSLPGGTVIPAGAYKFEPWTNGHSGSATVDVEVGYCTPPACTDKTPIVAPGSWAAQIPAADPGVTTTYTTQSPTTLPAGGPYQLYTTLHVTSPGAFSLLYDTGTDSTNIAVPRPSSEQPAVNSSVLFADRSKHLDTQLPHAGPAATLNLAKPGGTATFWDARPIQAGQAIPAGGWEFQYWTDGTDGSATLNLQAGYCDDGCLHRTPITGDTWRPTIAANSHGAATPDGAYTTLTPTQLPETGGPYHLYWTVSVDTPGPFNLQYDTSQAPTSVATPLPIPVHGR